MSGNAAEAGRTTTSRVLAILGAFSPASRSLNLAQLSENSGLPVPTVHRLAAELLEWGALERTESGRYRIGVRLWEVGSLAPAPQSLRTIALPFMQDLYEATHENVQLAVRGGDRVVYVEAISGRRSIGTASEIGGDLPMHATGVGKVVLAFSEPELLSHVLSQSLPSLTPFTITGRSAIAEVIQKVRTENIAFSREEMTLGVSAVASPILAADGSLIAALSIVARASVNLNALAPAVRTAAISIGRRSGALPTTWRMT